jgi:hypothetical protein
MMNNITALSTTSTGSSMSNSSSGSNGGGAAMLSAAANVVCGIMDKVLATPPMGSGISSSSSVPIRLYNDLDYLSSPGLDSDYDGASPLLYSGSSSSSNLTNQYLRLAISSNNNKEQQHFGFNNSHHGNFMSR